MVLELRKALAELSPAEMRERAVDYRLMAASASTAAVRDALLGVAEGLEQGVAQAAPRSATSNGPVPIPFVLPPSDAG